MDNIVMIHGMWGGPWYWEDYKNFFQTKGYHCITPTLRFHDMDPQKPPDPRLGNTGVLDYIDDLQKEIAKFDTPPILMGHSMGGLLAQILGARGLAKAIVLLTPAPPAGIFALRPSVVRCFLSGLAKWGFWKKPMRPTFNEVVYSSLRFFPLKEQQELYSKFVYESGRAICQIGFWFLDPNKTTSVAASKVNCPVLVIAGGTHDKITPTPIVRKVAHKYGTSPKEFPSHAHWVVGEPGWQEIAGYVSDWLDEALKENP